MPRNFNVCVYLLSGSELRIASDGQEESIVDFKKRLAQKTGMDHFGQRLFDSDNKELLNLQTLSEAGVRCGSVLRCVFDADQPPELVSSSSDGEVGKSARRVGKSTRRRWSCPGCGRVYDPGKVSAGLIPAQKAVLFVTNTEGVPLRPLCSYDELQATTRGALSGRTPGTLRTVVITSALVLLAAVPYIVQNPLFIGYVLELAALSRAGVTPAEMFERTGRYL